MVIYTCCRCWLHLLRGPIRHFSMLNWTVELSLVSYGLPHHFTRANFHLPALTSLAFPGIYEATNWTRFLPHVGSSVVIFACEFLLPFYTQSVAGNPTSLSDIYLLESSLARVDPCYYSAG